jgi:copper ion binding protein
MCNDQTQTLPLAEQANACQCAVPASDAGTSSDASGGADAAQPDLTTSVYTVAGMTCGHCVSAVTAEVGALAGVHAVAVNLPTGTVTVTSDAPLTDTDVRAAVDEAGYELTGTPGTK